MSAMKRFAEEVSEEMGLSGEITDAVLEEAQRRIEQLEMVRLLTDRYNNEKDGDLRELSDIRKKLMFILAPELLRQEEVPTL